MKTYADPSKVPQTEGHPEPFPDVTTMPKGWDLSEILAPQASGMAPANDSFEIRLDARMAVEDDLA
jgi:hypothetical protein